LTLSRNKIKPRGAPGAKAFFVDLGRATGHRRARLKAAISDGLLNKTFGGPSRPPKVRKPPRFSPENAIPLRLPIQGERRGPGGLSTNHRLILERSGVGPFFFLSVVLAGTWVMAFQAETLMKW
jgi:hypothetical protein